MNNDPHHQLNEHNAILLNTRNPVYYQQTYEKTLQKNFEKCEEQKKLHAEEQLQKIENGDQDGLRESQMMRQWEEEDQNLQDDGLDDLLEGLQKDNQVKWQPGFDVIDKEGEAELDVDKLGFHSVAQGQPTGAATTGIQTLTTPDQSDAKFDSNSNLYIDYDAINRIGEQITQNQKGKDQNSQISASNSTKVPRDTDVELEASKHLQEQNLERRKILEGGQKHTQTGPHKSVSSPIVNMIIDASSDKVEQKILAELQQADGFEEIKQSDVQQALENNQEAVNKGIASCIDVGEDSFYPLVTEDPERQKEFTIKIPQNNFHSAHMNQVFDQTNQSHFNLQSVYINNNHVPTDNKDKK